MIKLIKLLKEEHVNKLPSVKFTWQNSSRKEQVPITLLWDYRNNKPLVPIIGYCDGGDVPISPQPKTYAVMFEFENEDVWVHISKDDFNEYIT